MRPDRIALAVTVAACALAATIAGGPAATAAGGSGVSGWDGINPFKCKLQYAGTGTAVPDPAADPYCVEFDKTHQNFTQLGLVEFLTLEPARSAAAVPKCFYFQSDHWTGSIVQGDGQTELYHFDGHYFFDKARGAGGVWVTNFNINGHTSDPGQLPGMPAQWAQYFGPGTGGAQGAGNFPADPACAAKAAAYPSAIYAPPAAPGATPGVAPSPSAPCLLASGAVTSHGIGVVSLDEPESRVRALLGDPYDVRAGFLRYCLSGGGKYMVGQSSPGSGPVSPTGAAATVMILTTHPAFSLHDVRRGSRASLFRARFRHARALLTQARTRVWSTAPGSDVLVGVRMGRVRFLAVYDRATVRTKPALAALLRRSQ